MGITERLAEAEARNYERRAELAGSPRTAERLRAKATETRRRAGLLEGPEAPTVQLPAVNGPSPETSGPTLRQKIMGVTVVLVLLGAGYGWVSSLGGDEEPPTGSAAYTADDRQACQTGGASLQAVDDALANGNLDSERGRTETRADVLIAAEQMQGAALQADSARLTRVLSDGATAIRGTSDALDAEPLRGPSGAIFAACSPVSGN